MIKFFRKIRQQFITENRFGKYLFYAIGEIILVVIGILIAMQINNWNELRKQELEVRQYLERIEIDLDLDIEYFNFHSEDINKHIEYYELISYGKYSEVDLSEFSLMVSWNSNPRDFSKSYRSLEQQGKLSFISDELLIDSLRLYFDDLCLKYNDWTVWHKNFVGQNIEGFLMHNLPSISASKTDSAYVRSSLKQGQLISVVNKQLRTANHLNKRMLRNSILAKNTRQMIQQYLKNK